MSVATVKITAKTRGVLKELAERSGESMSSILEKAIEDYRRRHFLEDSNRAYENLRADPKAWDECQAERAAWDVTLGDGLESE